MQGLLKVPYMYECSYHSSLLQNTRYVAVYIVVSWKHAQYDVNIRSRCVQRKLGAARQVDVLSLCQRIRFDLLP
jgi:hypothetical protein